MKKKFKREIAAGGVVCRQQNNKFEILLLLREKKNGKVEWILPKGKVADRSEQLPDTALREIQEETGLKDLFLLDKLGRETYIFKDIWNSGEMTFKIVTYFLIKSKDNKEPKPQATEGLIEARWYDLGGAIKAARYKNSKKIIEKAIKLISENYEQYSKI